MNCRRAEELIQQTLLDGGASSQITTQERRDLDAHQSDCAACRAAAEEYRALARLSSAWAQRPMDENTAAGSADAFAAGVLARITPLEETAAAARRRFPILSWPRPALLALTVAGLAVLSFFFGPAIVHALTLPGDLLPRPDAVANVPAWLLTSARALPQDALSTWAEAQRGFSLPTGGVGLPQAFLVALVINALLFVYATRFSNGRQQKTAQ